MDDARQRVLDNEAKYISDIAALLACMEVDHKNRKDMKAKLPRVVERYILLLDKEEEEEKAKGH